MGVNFTDWQPAWAPAVWPGVVGAVTVTLRTPQCITAPAPNICVLCSQNLVCSPASYREAWTGASRQKILIMNCLNVDTMESLTSLGGWHCSVVALEKRRVTDCLSNSDCSYLLGNDLQCLVAMKGVIKGLFLSFCSCNWTNLWSAMWQEVPFPQNAYESY